MRSVYAMLLTLPLVLFATNDDYPCPDSMEDTVIAKKQAEVITGTLQDVRTTQCTIDLPQANTPLALPIQSARTSGCHCLSALAPSP